MVARVHRPVRSFRLNKLGISLPEAFAFPRRTAIGLAAAVFDRWNRGRTFLELLGNMQIAQEARAMTAQSSLPAEINGRIYLNGYWQTAVHFLSVQESLLPLLLPRFSPSSAASAWMEKVRRRPAAFVHVRRGDYAWTAGEAGLLPTGYYQRAAKALRSELGSEPAWFVFAEDGNWARSNLDFLPEFQLVDYESPDRDIEDLQLMAACDAGIIANSSYSWWGAAMGDRPGRLIIAPDRYWNRKGADTTAWRLPVWQPVTAWGDPA